MLIRKWEGKGGGRPPGGGIPRQSSGMEERQARKRGGRIEKGKKNTPSQRVKRVQSGRGRWLCREKNVTILSGKDREGGETTLARGRGEEFLKGEKEALNVPGLSMGGWEKSSTTHWGSALGGKGDLSTANVLLSGNGRK